MQNHRSRLHVGGRRRDRSFEVLSLSNELHEPPPPPSSRAPEPYKIAPRASSSGQRGQRKSSFAIIAEPIPAASGGRSSSPQQQQDSYAQHTASGRASPFRGRGFKGPTQRSRPQSPPDRAVSVSQHSSPRRSAGSQIPRPARSRSVSREAGRRQYVSSVTGNQQRRITQAKKISELPKTRASPRKPVPRTSTTTTTTTVAHNQNNQENRKNEINRMNQKPSSRNLLQLPGKDAPKRFITAKQPVSNSQAAAEGLERSSKIPLRRDSLTNSPAKLPTASSDLSVANRDKITSDLSKKTEDVGLVNLLKQSSGVTGTSSVVSTTTTTAVQPLHIDAASILSESELVAKLNILEKNQNQKENEDKGMEPTRINRTDQKEAVNPKSIPIEDKSKTSNNTQATIKSSGPGSTNEGKSNGQSNKQTKQSEGNSSSSIRPADKNSSTVVIEPEKDIRQVSSSGGTPAALNQKSKPTNSEVKTSIESSSVPKETFSQTKLEIHNKTTDTTSTDSSNKKIEEKKSKDSNLTDIEKNKNQILLKSQPQATSSESLGSIRSTDTGVSVNTVRPVSSAKEKTDSRFIERQAEIETLSGNIIQNDRNGERNTKNIGPGTTTATTTTAATTNGPGVTDTEPDSQVQSRWQKFRKRCWKGGKVAGCWPKMRCLACRRDPKFQLWPGKQARTTSTVQLTPANLQDEQTLSKWARFKDACRCTKLRRSLRLRNRRWQRQQIATLENNAPAPTHNANQEQRRIAQFCREFWSRCACKPSCPSWSCRGRRESKQSQKSRKTVRAKHSITSVTAPPLSEETRPKIPDVLVEHNSVMRGAIPCLPVPLAWFCLICNLLIPGSGTVLSGVLNLCIGQPRFSATASPKARFGALIVNILVGVSQLFTVLFCLVGWGWSIWWGVSMIRLARKYKRFKNSEAIANDPEARGSMETATLPTPGIPAQALRATTETRPR